MSMEGRMEPTHRQYNILKSIETSRKGFTNFSLTTEHWDLVRNGYINNLVSFGNCEWIFEITEKGKEYLEGCIESEHEY